MLAASLLRRLPAPLLASLLLTSPALAKKELGVNVHQSPTVGVDIARDAKLGWVRIDLNWFNVEQAQGKQDWGVIDAVIDAARARNLQVLGVIGYGPAWASSGDTKGDGANNDVPKEGAYAAFVKLVVERYQGKVTHYELWNEPNLGDFFEGTPQDYLARVLKPGAAALHAACASCKVVGPGLATVGDQYATWMDTILGAAKGDIDIVSGHIYAGFPAEGSGVGKTSDSFFNKLESHRVVTFEGSVLYEGGLSFKEVMDKHGVSKPFWLTETGRQAKLGDAPALEEQRLYYRQTLEAMLSRPWWQTTLFYEAFDEAATPDLNWGLGLHDDTAPGGYQPKPAFDLLKQVIAAQPEFGGSQHDCIDFLDNDGDGQVDSADSACSGGSLSEGAASASGSGGSGQSGAGGSGGSGQGGAGGSGGAGGPGGAGQAASGGSGQAGSAPGQGGAGGSGGAAGASSGQGGKGGSGLKSDLDLNEKPADDGGGCAQGRGATGGGLAVLVAGLAASLRRRRGERRA